MQCYLFLTQSKVYDRENQSLLKDVMKRRKEIYNKSKRSTLNENGKFNYTIHYQDEKTESGNQTILDVSNNKDREIKINNTASNRSTPGPTTSQIKKLPNSTGGEDFYKLLN